MGPKIVVTGFEPWASAAENPTLLVLDLLDRTRPGPGPITTLRLPVDAAALTSLTTRALDEIRPDLWISLGLAPGSAVIAIERIAANVLDFTVPDNAGLQPAGVAIFADAPAAYLATLPVGAIVRDLRAGGIPAAISNSPGTFLCNQMMYTTLHLIATKGWATRAGFIHVPAHPALAARSAGAMPSMSLDLMVAAVRTTIETALGAREATRGTALNA